MTPPPPPAAASAPLSNSTSTSVIDALQNNHAPNANGPTKTQNDGGAHTFAKLCAEQQRLVAAFLALKKPNRPEMTLDTLQRAQAQTRQSLDILREALRRFRLDALSLSYNGGKDCLVLLMLCLAALADTFLSDSDSSRSENQNSTSTSSTNANNANSSTSTASPSLPSAAIPDSTTNHTSSVTSNHTSTSSSTSSLPLALASVYIEAPHPFAQLTSFVESSAAAYGLTLARHRGDKGLRAAFAAYCAAQPGIEAILVGTRRSDPHGARLAAFQPTDSGWPQFVRVLPMLEWHYEEIWAFLRAIDVEYCELYDQGYTSLGGTNDTRPNPALSRGKDAQGVETFRPAYELVGDAEERLGRDR